MKCVQISLHLNGLSKYSSLFSIEFILWAVGRGQNSLDTRYKYRDGNKDRPGYVFSVPAIHFVIKM